MTSETWGDTLKVIDSEFRNTIETIRNMPGPKSKWKVASVDESRDEHGRPVAIVRFTTSKTKKVGCLVLIILFVTVLGILLIPFLPKEDVPAGWIRLTGDGSRTFIEAHDVAAMIATSLLQRFPMNDVADGPTGDSSPQRAPSVPAPPRTDDRPPPSWQPDPTGRHQFRYWDGSKFTDHIADYGETGSDPAT